MNKFNDSMRRANWQDIKITFVYKWHRFNKATVHPKALKIDQKLSNYWFQKYSYQYFGGVDLFAFKGINQNPIMRLMSAGGTYTTKFYSSKAFSNSLHLCPNEKKRVEK